MREFAGWVNAETMRLIGMALLHFLWQGVAIAAAALRGHDCWCDEQPPNTRCRWPCSR